MSRTIHMPPIVAVPIGEPLKYPRRPRRFFGTYGVHPGAPCLWDSKESALENCDPDERVYEFLVEMVREVKP